MTWQPRSNERRMVLTRDGAACRYCGRRVYPRCMLTDQLWLEIGLTFDHLIPRARKGPSEAWNLFISCYACNSEKGNRGPSDDWSPMAPPRNPIPLEPYRGAPTAPERPARKRSRRVERPHRPQHDRPPRASAAPT